MNVLCREIGFASDLLGAQSMVIQSRKFQACQCDGGLKMVVP